MLAIIGLFQYRPSYGGCDGRHLDMHYMFQRLRPTKVIKDMSVDDDDEIVTSATFSVGKQCFDSFTREL